MSGEDQERLKALAQKAIFPHARLKKGAMVSLQDEAAKQDCLVTSVLAQEGNKFLLSLMVVATGQSLMLFWIRGDFFFKDKKVMLASLAVN